VEKWNPRDPRQDRSSQYARLPVLLDWIRPSHYDP
jgi:hypothetical protein